MKKRVAILRGGPSSEYDVSLKTGKAIFEALINDHDLIDVVIDKNGDWHVGGVKKEPQKALESIDAVFNAMHGEYGEDGKVQQILDQIKVPYSGARALAAALSMNKVKTKDLYKQHGIKTPLHKVLSKPESDGGLEFQAMLIFRNFAMPVVLKPVDKGSSLGVSIARTFDDLLNTMKSLYATSDQILVEEYIAGKEATVGVVEGLRGQKHYPLFPIEIKKPTQDSLFDFNLKYPSMNKSEREPSNPQSDKEAAQVILKAETLCPGNFTKEESQILQQLAVKAHQILDLRHYSRTDFILHPRRGIYALETNALPGLTQDSLLPQALKAHGVEYRDFLMHILDLLLR
jgi:D-alanine-D-alanine ligase